MIHELESVLNSNGMAPSSPMAKNNTLYKTHIIQNTLLATINFSFFLFYTSRVCATYTLYFDCLFIYVSIERKKNYQIKWQKLCVTSLCVTIANKHKRTLNNKQFVRSFFVFLFLRLPFHSAVTFRICVCVCSLLLLPSSLLLSLWSFW